MRKVYEERKDHGFGERCLGFLLLFVCAATKTKENGGISCLRVTIMKSNRPWAQQDIDNFGKDYCLILRDRVKEHRQHGNIRRGQWDIPRVAAACASNTSPYVMERGHNCADLRNPHQTLKSSYPSVKNEQWAPQYPGEPHYSEGHCAEPHAAHKVLNEMDKCHHPIQIQNLQFGKAYEVKYITEKANCATCKLTFPQLR